MLIRVCMVMLTVIFLSSSQLHAASRASSISCSLSRTTAVFSDGSSGYESGLSNACGGINSYCNVQAEDYEMVYTPTAGYFCRLIQKDEDGNFVYAQNYSVGYSCRGPQCFGTPKNDGVAGEDDGTGAGPGAGDPELPPGQSCNPVRISEGRKFETESDFVGRGPFPLTFNRFYNSSYGNWTHSYMRSLNYSIDAATGDASVVANRPDGKVLTFTGNKAGILHAGSNIKMTLSLVLDASGAVSGATIITRSDVQESYDIQGRLMLVTDRLGFTQSLAYDVNQQLESVTDSGGRQLLFTHDGNGFLSSMTTPDGNTFHYKFDVLGRLLKVYVPDETPADINDNPFREYKYEGNPMWVMTGIIDETGKRIKNVQYVASNGRVNYSELGAGKSRTTFNYVSDNLVKITNALGRVTDYHFTEINGFDRVTKIEGHGTADCVGGIQDYAYDSNGFVIQKIDWEGNITQYTRDDRGNALTMTEAVGTPVQRQTTTTWHSNYRLPTRIEDSLRIIERTYDSAGRVLSETITGKAKDSDMTGKGDMLTIPARSRTTTYSYHPTGTNGEGQIATIDGPRNDVNDKFDYLYDSQGNLIEVKNSLGLSTKYRSFNGAGRPLERVDYNGVVTSYEYDYRGRLSSSETMGARIAYEYDDAENLVKTTQPDGSYLLYTYNAANQMTRVEDNAGNYIVYTLNALGGREKEEIFDASGTLRKTKSRIFNALNRVVQSIGSENQAKTNFYNANGDPIATLDARLNPTDFEYDALNRLIRTVDASDGATVMDYDANNRLISVTDANGNATRYTFDGLGNLVAQFSPDTGLTRYTYDDAGNRLSKLDSNNVLITYAYDAVNRLIETKYPDGINDVAYVYDNPIAANSQGRLSSIVSPHYRIDYTYDERGNITRESRKTGSQIYDTQYAYTLRNQLASIIYPSGRIVTYVYDALGKVSDVVTQESPGAANETIASGISYLPFGPMTSLTYGNGLKLDLAYDADYRISSIKTADLDTQVLDASYEFDLAGNVASITDNLNASKSQQFQYDALNRLIDAAGSYGNYSYSYDPVGNRTSREKLLASGTTLETYEFGAASNQLLSVTYNQGGALSNRAMSYDGNGNTVLDQRQTGSLAFEYDNSNRLSRVTKDSGDIFEYDYNALGQRIAEISTNKSVHVHYDQSGQRIGVSDANGNMQQEYIYLGGLRLALIDVAAPYVEPPAPITVDSESSDVVVKGTWTASTHVAGYLGEYYLGAMALGADETLPEDPSIQNGSNPNNDPSSSSSSALPYLYWSLDEQNGSIAFDESGSGHHGQLSGMSFDNNSVSGYTNGALSLGNGLLKISNADFSGATALTVAAWVKTDALGQTQRIISKAQANGPGTFILEYTGKSKHWRWSVWDGDSWKKAHFKTTEIHNGEWHHVAATVDASSHAMSLLIDGHEVATAKFDADQISDDANLPLLVGGAEDGNALVELFDGEIDEMYVYPRALSNSEVVALMGMKTDVPVNYHAGLMAYLSFDETSGTVASDQGGVGNDGALINADFTQQSTAGKLNGALDLTGVNRAVDLGDIEMGEQTAITLSIWTKTTDTTGYHRLISKDRQGKPGNFHISYDAGARIIHFIVRDSGVWRDVAATKDISNGVWHHIGAVVDGTAGFIKLYVDGQLVAQSPFDSAALDDTDNESLVIGADSNLSAPNHSFQGQVDEFRIYNRGLGATEMTQLSQAVEPDADGDGIVNSADVFPFDASESADSDGDGFGDNADAFPADPNASAQVIWPLTIATTGSYEVYARWTADSNRATNAKYRIHTGQIVTEVTVNQQINGGNWVNLGAAYFSAEEENKISLSNAGDGYIVADGIEVRWLEGQSSGNAETSLYFVHNDHLQRSLVITDQDQQEKWRGEFEPFGGVISISGEVENSSRFPGQYQDQVTNLFYNLNRFYDPTLGRYSTSDPLGLEGGINTYAYVLANPLLYTDPYGLKEQLGESACKKVGYQACNQAEKRCRIATCGQQFSTLCVYQCQLLAEKCREKVDGGCVGSEEPEPTPQPEQPYRDENGCYWDYVTNWFGDRTLVKICPDQASCNL